MWTKEKTERFCKDLIAANTNVDTRIDTALSRGEWYKCYTEGAINYQSAYHKKQASLELGKVRCNECRRTFRREADKVRHKCLVEQQKPEQDQRGATQCGVCERWFRNKDGLAVHRCKGPMRICQQDPEPTNSFASFNLEDHVD